MRQIQVNTLAQLHCHIRDIAHCFNVFKVGLVSRRWERIYRTIRIAAKMMSSCSWPGYCREHPQGAAWCMIRKEKKKEKWVGISFRKFFRHEYIISPALNLLKVLVLSTIFLKMTHIFPLFLFFCIFLFQTIYQCVCTFNRWHWLLFLLCYWRHKVKHSIRAWYWFHIYSLLPHTY